MYERYYELSERPFELTTNPRYLFLTPRHREALSALQYGLSARKGVILLLGEAGTGKSTLVRAALSSLQASLGRFVYINNPTLTRNEFLELLAHGFGLGEDAHTSKARFLLQLEQSLTQRVANGQGTALVIDEAQSMTHELFEEVRLLANLEAGDTKLLPVIIAGQPELADRLSERSLRQLKQRVALRAELVPLTLRETGAYIAKRIRIAGGDGARVFTREAVAAIHESSQGIPRTINVICDNALVSGFALERRPVDEAIVREVGQDLDLEVAPDEDATVNETFAPAAPADGRQPPVRPHLEALTTENATLAAAGVAAPRKRRFVFF